MTVREAISIIKKERPTCQDECSLKVKFIDEGAFRRTYRIVDLPLVIKFPHQVGNSYDTSHRQCIAHSALEVNKIKHLSHFKELRQHLPKVYFHDKKTGVVIMEYLEEREGTASYIENVQFEELTDLLGRLIKGLTRRKMTDINNSNMVLTASGLKFLDLGY